MSQFVPDIWLFVAEFEPLGKQAHDEPEDEFPNDAVSKCVAFINKEWGGLLEELPEFCEWTDTKLRVTSNLLEPIINLIAMMGDWTSPVRFVLTGPGYEGEEEEW